MGVGASARSVIESRSVWRLGWLAATWLVACVSTNLPEPAHGSPLSPHAETAPVMPVATSLTQDPLATVPPAVHDDHEHHHHAHAAPDAESTDAHEHHHSAADGGATSGSAHGQRFAQAPREPVYVCPMHPDVQQSTPGTCPRCGMKLVRAPQPAPKDPKPQPLERHGE